MPRAAAAAALVATAAADVIARCRLQPPSAPSRALSRSGGGSRAGPHRVLQRRVSESPHLQSPPSPSPVPTAYGAICLKGYWAIGLKGYRAIELLGYWAIGLCGAMGL